MDIHPIPVLRILVLVTILAPLGAAILCALAGHRNPRRLAMWCATLHLGLTGILVGGTCVELTQRGDHARPGDSRSSAEAMFTPIAVPGDPGHSGDPDSQIHETTWSLLPLGPHLNPNAPASEVQFFVGLDGLNVWLVGLASLMTVIAILVSWVSITERAGAYYAWLFVLQTGVIGAFCAFDVIVFYIFFELTLVPMFFLIGHWGVGGGRRDAARKFFLYTLFGGVLTLIGLIGIVLTNPTPLNPIAKSAHPLPQYGPGEPDQPVIPKRGAITFSVPRLMQNVDAWALSYWRVAYVNRVKAEAASNRLGELRQKAVKADSPAILQAETDLTTAQQRASESRADWEHYQLVQAWLFVALVAGFMVKVPVIPFHTWLPAAYGEAPIGVTMLLAALLAKLGTYGMLRLVLPLAPDAALEYGLPVIGTLAAAGILYAAFCAYAQRDMKLLTAFSSVSHLGFLVVALFAFNVEGITGATLHMVNHGLATGAMFAILGFLYSRYRTLDMNQYSGLWAKFPGYTFLVFLICLASIGLPGLNNFVSEMLMLAGLFDPSLTNTLGYGLAVCAAVGILLSAWYVLTMLRRVFFGPLLEPATATASVRGLTGREAFAYGVPAALCILLGLFPNPVLDTMKADAGVVAKFGEHARRRAGSWVERHPDELEGPVNGQQPAPPGGRPPAAPQPVE